MKIKLFDNRKVFNWHEENGSIPFFSFKMLDELGVPHAYTTRYKADGEKGIRVAFMKDEDPAEARPVIAGNLGALAEQLGSDLEHVCLTNQKHTANIRLITARNKNSGGEIDGLGYWNSVEKTEPVDGLVTDVPGACLAVYGADCPSIYIVDKTKHVVALVHAGWKGTLAKIPQVAIEMMISEFGCDPANMYAAIGPSICESCYEMGDEVYDAFAHEWSVADADSILHRHPVLGKDASQYPDGKYHLDLWKANRMTLERCGVLPEHIEVTNICTCCNADELYSYRAHRMENEQVAMLVNAF